MRDEKAQIASGITTTKTASNGKKEGVDGGYSWKGKYFKLWALAAMSLLALWSMFTGSVTLKRSAAANLKHVSHHFDSAFHHHLDILEVEEREKKVKDMWNVYSRHSNTMRLPSFWQAAFEAAYEDLVSEVPATQNAAISEIAKMSFHPSLLYDLEFESPLPESPYKTRTSRKKDNKLGKLEKKGKQQKH
ncbi:hypothetical protein Leryth_013471 [Lithospermum erythrorhizon]|nr:hypothetical protein Leryth_013471 [Lithospermum erythrorhizon]